jgi:hypothetical protein
MAALKNKFLKEQKQKFSSKIKKIIKYQKGNSMKLISFSIWGNDERLFNGAIENAILTKRIYGNDWEARFYCDENIPKWVIDKLSSLGSQIVICRNVKGPWEGLFWRFNPASSADVSVVISRDIDSRLNSREKYAVNEWLSSDKGFHIMRDCYMHDVPILGGMWGAKRGCIPEMMALISQWATFDRRGVDQDFLGQIIYPRIKNNSMIHDEVVGPTLGWDEPTRKKWPSHPPIEWGSFVGDYVFEKVL